MICFHWKAVVGKRKTNVKSWALNIKPSKAIGTNHLGYTSSGVGLGESSETVVTSESKCPAASFQVPFDSVGSYNTSHPAG